MLALTKTTSIVFVLPLPGWRDSWPALRVVLGGWWRQEYLQAVASGKNPLRYVYVLFILLFGRGMLY